MAEGWQEASRRAYEALPEEIRVQVPPEDAWALDVSTRRLRLQEEASRRLRLARTLGEGVDPSTGKRLREDDLLAKRDAFKSACAADPCFFMDNCIWTSDPERKVGVGSQRVPLVLFGFARKLWIAPWMECLEQGSGRWIHDKSRRMLVSIVRMAFEAWRFRFVPGSSSWVATDKEPKLDNWYDFDSLLGKFRNMWDAARDAYPWLFPALPPHSDVNKLRYLRFPDWTDGKRKLDPEVCGNQLKGVLPTDPRGGAASDGFVDEAGWIQDLDKLLDAAENMTPTLVMASSAPPDTQNLFWKRREL
jgi:hypothetical protein